MRCFVLKKKYLHLSKVYYIRIFFVALVVGTVLANIIVPKSEVMANTLAVHEVALDKLSLVSWEDLFINILGMRFLQFVCICLVVNTWRKQWFYVLCVVVVGLVFGMQTATETMYFGVCGVCYSICAWLPQMLFYGVMVYLLYDTVVGARMMKGQLTSWGMISLRYIVMLAIMVLGCLSEAFINPKLLCFCMEYIV